MLFSFPYFYGSGSTYHRCDMGGPCGSKWMCQKHQYINTAEGVKLDRAHEDMYLHLSIKYFLKVDKYGILRHTIFDLWADIYGISKTRNI